MPKYYYSANGKVIERMTETSDSLNLQGNLEIAGAIRAGSYQDIKGEPLSFVNPKGELTIGGITSKDNKIGINQKFPITDLHVGQSLYIGSDDKWSSRTSSESAEQERSEFKGQGFLTTPWLNASHIEAINKNGEIHFYGANGRALSINKKIENDNDPMVSVPGVFHAKTVKADKYMLGNDTIHQVATEVATKVAQETTSQNVKSNIFEITGNIPHPDRGDGMIYRADGQLQISTDDFVRFRHRNSKQTGIQVDTRPGAGDIRNPNGQLKISRQGIMFGGANTTGYQVDSAQISAGLHRPNSLNIVGMSDNKGKNRKIHMWAEGGLNIAGKVIAKNGLDLMVDNRNERLTPKQYRAKGIGKYTEFKSGHNGLPGGFSFVETIVPWPDTSGGKVKQIAYSDNGVYYRVGKIDDSAWESNFQKL